MTEKPVTRHRLPVLPLRNVVLFPGVTIPVAAGRPGTLRAVDLALESEDRLIFVVSQRENVEQVQPEILHTMGVIARIGQVHRGLGGNHVLLHGERRATVLQFAPKSDSMEAVVQEVADLEPLDKQNAAFLALNKEVRERAAELGKSLGISDDVLREALDNVDDPGAVADLVAGYLDISAQDRQAILETLGVEERLRRVLLQLQRQLQLVKAQEDIKEKVQQEIGEKQREIYLREQLKAIRRELGEEEEETERDELRERLEKLDLPDAARKEVRRELSRLQRTSRESAEAQVIRTYLETIAELPWNEQSEDDLDLARAQGILDEDHYGLQDVKDRVLEFLAVRRLRDRSRGSSSASDASGASAELLEPDIARAPILLFAGPPGVGKTSIGKSIARAMGRQYVRISLGGARDEADIRGHRRTYIGAMPGQILQGMKQAGTRNPVFMLDEVDKLGISFQGDPAAALLEVLDPAQNNSFVDHYLGVPFDLSQVLFICTANFLQNIPGPLLDRMEAVDFVGYTEAEKKAIARQYLIPRQMREAGLTPEQLVLDEDALHELIGGYTREAGVRQLERELGRVARKVARRIATGEIEREDVGREDIRPLLGRPKVHPERARRTDEVGVATGMYYTPVGGDIMFVEVAIIEGGKGELILTGQLGDVMKESARAALSFAKSHAAELHIPTAMLGSKDIHIHVPAGAIPKDGPSAGVTMATALVSALSGVPVRHDVAMTGEITLSGRVLPIGGVKEKVLGACRAGVTNILLPKENLPDLEDLSQTERARIEVFAVERLEETLDITLRRPQGVPVGPRS